MKKIIFIILLSLLVIGSYAQKTDISTKKSEIKSLLKTHLYYKDPNPIWQEDADKVNIFVKNILSKEYKKAEKDKLRAKAFELLYENTQCIMFEDMVDIKRMSKRKSMCYLAIAMLSDEYRYPAFIEDARQCIKELDMEDMSREETLIDIVEIRMILGDNEMQTQEKNRRILSYIDLFNERKSKIENKVFVNDVTKLFNILR